MGVIKIEASDYLVLASVLRRRTIESLSTTRGGGGDRSALLSEITQLIKLIEPVASHDKYFHTHTELAQMMISADDPMSALDHIVALLARCGAVPTQPPPLSPFVGSDSE
ncbi:hypothetical protein BN2476_540010 [Paraburkholderia piptadeniae]|uniref:Uncharacterized protein n=1 Tax=Paraburkholderia piptadeniae TaxID=1701573 RepID=A0A1N7SHY6_9BURK|nr:hypothetical protein [Paraburkholderia piptadeniae]SIT46997.1 hypothetical protein BN2476_540010 [Paraburkholderia piptadeniae]